MLFTSVKKMLKKIFQIKDIQCIMLLLKSQTIHNHTELTRYIRICSNIPENLFHCHRALRHFLHLHLLLLLKSDGIKFILAINLVSEININIEIMIHT